MNDTQFGLQELPDDPRDLNLGGFFSLPDPKELPADFSIVPRSEIIIREQIKDTCTGHATCGASQLQEGVELNPNWVFAKAKELAGSPLSEFGVDLRSACKVHQKFGAVEGTGELLPNMSFDDARDITKYPPMYVMDAAKHKKQAFAAITGPYDAFDNIRVSLWKFREEKRAGIIGTRFPWPLSQEVMETAEEKGYGHAMWAFGWQTRNGQPYLEVVNSAGKQAGDNGFHLFSREVINKFVPRYGAFMFLDMPKEQLQFNLDNNIKETDPWFVSIVKPFIQALRELFQSPFLSLEEIETIKTTAETVINKEAKKETEPRLIKFCKAIEKHEGYGTKNAPTITANFNPGALRESPFQYAKKGGFAAFHSYEEGMKALQHQVRIVCNGTSPAYRARARLAYNIDNSAELTFTQFFSIYAPSTDRNNPVAYAKAVAASTGLPVTTKMKELLMST